MGWGDVRYCFAMAILVTTPRLLSGAHDVLLFYFLFHYSCYSSTHVCPLDFSEMP
jgi:hypothetical protein